MQSSDSEGNNAYDELEDQYSEADNSEAIGIYDDHEASDNSSVIFDL